MNPKFRHIFRGTNGQGFDLFRATKGTQKTLVLHRDTDIQTKRQMILIYKYEVLCIDFGTENGSKPNKYVLK